MLERARSVAGRIRPGEHFVAHRPHGELTDRGDQTEADVEVPELEGKALCRSKVGERRLCPGDRVALARAPQLRLDRSGLDGEMPRVHGEQLGGPGVAQAGAPIFPERLEQLVTGRASRLWTHSKHGALGEPGQQVEGVASWGHGLG